MSLASYLLLAPRPEAIALEVEEECIIDFDNEPRDVRFITTVDELVATVAEGSLTGLLGVGIGEVVLPQLVRGCCMPLPVSAGTSVAIVITTAAVLGCVHLHSFSPLIIKYMLLNDSSLTDLHYNSLSDMYIFLPINTHIYL